MTPLLLSVLILLALYGVYIAAISAQHEARPADFLDGGQALPGWAPMFLLPALGAAGLGLEPNLALVTRFGLQASHLAVGFVLVAMAALLLWNRMWYVARIARLSTPGEALGQFYGSVTLRVTMLALAVLFALPFSANLLSSAAQLLERATDGVLPRAAGVWVLAISLAIPAIIGGWRATIITLAMQAVLLALFLPGSTILAEILAVTPGFPAVPIPVPEGVLWDRLPGVIQYSAGIGKEIPVPGIFTTVALSSSTIALLGIVFSPATLYLGQTASPGRAVGISTVLLAAGLLTGILVLGAPLLGTRMAAGPVALAAQFYAFEPLAGVGLIVMLLVGAMLAVSFFVTGGAILVTRELVVRYLFPDMSEQEQRFSARVAIGFMFFFLAFMASFLPLISAILGSVALPLAVQLLPAFLGLTFLRWISRGAVLAGMTLGMLIVFFTEPPGLILFEGLFVNLPWGRWPLTIHSAAWGLVINMALVLLASAATLRAPDNLQRNRLHDAMFQATGMAVGGRGLFWALMLLWGFLAYGPGAVLGNTFFSHPIFTSGEAALGIPSLWVWQILFWLLGVVLVWWIGFRVGFGRTSEEGIRTIELEEGTRRRPDWLAAGLSRVNGRER
jgi:solute:Na+ symporter, SSS family